jgi:hypothetical protein
VFGPVITTPDNIVPSAKSKGIAVSGGAAVSGAAIWMIRSVSTLAEGAQLWLSFPGKEEIKLSTARYSVSARGGFLRFAPQGIEEART